MNTTNIKNINKTPVTAVDIKAVTKRVTFKTSDLEQTDKKTDQLSLSKTAIDFIKATKQEDELALNLAELKKAQAEAKAKSDEYSDTFKCMRIASRIMSGDKVPQKDREYLAKNEPEMYAKALMLRCQKKNPKEYKSLVDDEEETTEQASQQPEETTENQAQTAVSAAESAEFSETTE